MSNYDLEEALAMVDDNSIYPDSENPPSEEEKEKFRQIIKEAWETA